MVEINIEKQIPDTVGQGMGNGAKALGKGVGKGVEALGNGTGNGIQSFGQGLGYLASCIGDRIKYGKSLQLLMQQNGSTILEVAKSMSTQPVKPETLTGAVKYQEEENLRRFIKNVVKEILDREDHNESLPKDFHNTDSMLAIEKAAAETNDNDLSKMWARLFVEEATQPDSISKASIDILKKMDKKNSNNIARTDFSILY